MSTPQLTDRPVSRLFVASVLALGASVGVGACSVVWLIACGIRSDAQGTSPTNTEMILGWGGLLTAVILFVASLAAVATGDRAHRVVTATVREAVDSD